MARQAPVCEWCATRLSALERERSAPACFKCARTPYYFTLTREQKKRAMRYPDYFSQILLEAHRSLIKFRGYHGE
jgi:hypothetical protein